MAGMAEYLDTIANKEGGKDVELCFEGERLRVGIVLVAKPEKVDVSYLNNYIKAVEEEITKCCTTIYLAGLGRKNISFIKSIAKLLEQHKDIEKVVVNEHKHTLKGSLIKAVCVTVVPKSPTAKFFSRSDTPLHAYKSAIHS